MDFLPVMELLVMALESKPVAVLILFGIVIYGGFAIKTGKLPFKNYKKYVEKGDLKEAEERIEEKLESHNASNDKDFKEVKENIKDLSETVNTGFHNLNMRIDNFIDKGK